MLLIATANSKGSLKVASISSPNKALKVGLAENERGPSQSSKGFKLNNKYAERKLITNATRTCSIATTGYFPAQLPLPSFLTISESVTSTSSESSVSGVGMEFLDESPGVNVWPMPIWVKSTGRRVERRSVMLPTLLINLMSEEYCSSFSYSSQDIST